MQKNSSDFSMQEALRLAKSPTAAQASQGNSGAARETLQTLLASPQVQAMLQQLRREQNG